MKTEKFRSILKTFEANYSPPSAKNADKVNEIKANVLSNLLFEESKKTKLSKREFSYIVEDLKNILLVPDKKYVINRVSNSYGMDISVVEGFVDNLFYYVSINSFSTYAETEKNQLIRASVWVLWPSLNQKQIDSIRILRKNFDYLCIIFSHLIMSDIDAINSNSIDKNTHMWINTKQAWVNSILFNMNLEKYFNVLDKNPNLKEVFNKHNVVW